MVKFIIQPFGLYWIWPHPDLNCHLRNIQRMLSYSLYIKRKIIFIFDFFDVFIAFCISLKSSFENIRPVPLILWLQNWINLIWTSQRAMPKWSKFGQLSFNKALLWPWPLMKFCIWQEKYSMLLQSPNLKAVYWVTSKQDWPRQEKFSLWGLGGCDHFLRLNIFKFKSQNLKYLVVIYKIIR